MTHTKRFLAAIVLALAALTVARAETPAGPPRAVKGLLIGLTGDEKIGPGVATDLKMVESYLRGLPGFDADRDLRKLTGAQVTPANIEQAIQDLEVGPNDVLFCYYAGHGAYDPNLTDDDPSGGHFFQIPDGDLRRADLLGWLKDKGARLTVLITETCNAEGEYNPPDTNAGASESASESDAAPAPEAIVSEAFKTLLFGFTGVVDVSGASRDQYGIATEKGSLSTVGLVQALEAEDKVLNDTLSQFPTLFLPTEQPSLDWEGFIGEASKDVHSLYQAMKDAELARPEPNDDVKEFHEALRAQDDLQPQVFVMDVQPVGAAPGDDNFVPPPPPAPDGAIHWDDLIHGN